MFHKAKTVTTLSDYRLLVHFADGADKEYDMKPLFEQYPVFLELKETPGLFDQAKADVGGYGIVWNEDIDIDAQEIYQNGRDVRTPFTGLISFTDAATMKGLNESTLRKAVEYGKLIPGIDVCNLGKQWVITEKALEREYPDQIVPGEKRTAQERLKLAEATLNSIWEEDHE